MKSQPLNLKKLLEAIECGELQIPDFQRDWVWNDDQIKSLVESVIRGFPINSIMLLECDANKKGFSCKPIKNVSPSAPPRYLVLDGQQRLTSLYCALYSDKPVELPDGKKRFYYIDMKKAVDSVKNSENVEDMIISVPGDEKKKDYKKTKDLDLSTPEKEYAANMFPLNKIFSNHKWFKAYRKINNNDSEILEDDFSEEVTDKILQYNVVYIVLEKITPIAIVCKIFEKVNTGGTELTVFELLTAILAADDKGKHINLPNDWKEIQAKFAENPNSAVLKEVVSATDFVTALTLLVNYQKSRIEKGRATSCKRDDILGLKGEDYLKYKDFIVEGFNTAAAFLYNESICAKKYLPYATQLIPLAAIFANIKLNGIKADWKKISQWYWCGVFGEAYKAAQETRYVRDISEVTDWLIKGNAPKIINETQMSASRLMALKTRSSAAFKGIISIIFRKGAEDFLVGNKMGTTAMFMESIDIHHIFPKKYCIGQKYSEDKFDSVANKTPILDTTNKWIRDKAPSVYWKDIKSKTAWSDDDIKTILETHFANAELCRADDFDAFIIDRAKKIFDEIEKLTGRKISDRDSQDIIDVFGTAL